MTTAAPPHFCDDSELGYRRSLSPLGKDDSLRLDESYRLAHLPLVNPAHPDVIASVGGKDYQMGRHRRVHSLVLPVPEQALEQSEAFQSLQKILRKSPIAHKLAWDIIGQRRMKLHATLCGSLGEGELPLVLDPLIRHQLADIAPFEVELRGLLSGNINLGRLYLKLYPQKRAGENAIHAIQKAMGRKETDLYLVGLHNLTDHLDLIETRWLFDTLTEWWDRPILRFTVKQLWLLSSLDDLVLDSRIEEHFDLKRS